MTNTDFSAPRDITPNRMGTAGFTLSLSFIVLSFLYGMISAIIIGAGDSSYKMTDSVFLQFSTILMLNVWLLGLILSVLGLRSHPKGKATAGVIISLLPIISIIGIIGSQISTPISFENELKERKAQVIERIKDVRTAQRAFRAEYQRYAEDFDELERFLHANPTELRCDIEQLRYIPNSNNEFIMEIGFIKTSSNRTGPCIEVRTPYKLFLDTIKYRQEIINLIDEEENIFNRYPGIKFGSKEEANNEVGNWEE